MLNREHNNAREYDKNHNLCTKNLYEILYDNEDKNITKLFKGISKESKDMLISLQKIFEEKIKSFFIIDDTLIITIPENFRQIQELNSVVEIFCKMKKTFWTYTYIPTSFYIEFVRKSNS